VTFAIKNMNVDFFRLFHALVPPYVFVKSSEPQGGPRHEKVEKNELSNVLLKKSLLGVKSCGEPESAVLIALVPVKNRDKRLFCPKIH
jgi:hypothetical protein